MHTSLYLCIQINIVYIYICRCQFVYMYISICIHTSYNHIDIDIYIYIYIYMYIYEYTRSMYLYICIQKCIYIYIFICIFIYAYIHMYTERKNPMYISELFEQWVRQLMNPSFHCGNQHGRIPTPTSSQKSSVWKPAIFRISMCCQWPCSTEGSPSPKSQGLHLYLKPAASSQGAARVARRAFFSENTFHRTSIDRIDIKSAFPRTCFRSGVQHKTTFFN